MKSMPGSDVLSDNARYVTQALELAAKQGNVTEAGVRRAAQQIECDPELAARIYEVIFGAEGKRTRAMLGFPERSLAGEDLEQGVREGMVWELIRPEGTVGPLSAAQKRAAIRDVGARFGLALNDLCVMVEVGQA